MYVFIEIFKSVEAFMIDGRIKQNWKRILKTLYSLFDSRAKCIRWPLFSVWLTTHYCTYTPACCQRSSKKWMNEIERICKPKLICSICCPQVAWAPAIGWRSCCSWVWQTRTSWEPICRSPLSPWWTTQRYQWSPRRQTTSVATQELTRPV